MLKIIRNFIIALIIIVAALLLLLPLVMGHVIKSEFKDKVLKQKFPGDRQIQLVSYHTGWFTSQVIFNIDKNTGKQNKPLSHVDLTLLHGPFIFAKDQEGNRHFYWGQAVAHGTSTLTIPLDKKHLLLDGNKTLETHLYVHMNGDVLTHLTGKNFHLKVLADKGALSVGDLQAKLWLSHGLQRFNGKLTLKDVKFSNKEASMNVPTVFSAYHFNKEGASWYGQQILRIPEQQFYDTKQKPMLGLKNIDFMTSTKNEIDDIAFFQHLHVDKITYKNFFVGPADIKWAWNRVNKGRLTEIKNWLLAHEDQKKYTPKEQHEFAQLLKRLLAGSQVILQATTLKTPMGEVSLHGKFLFAPYKELSKSSSFIDYLSHVGSGRFIFSLSNSFLKPLPKIKDLLAPGPVIINNKKSAQKTQEKKKKEPMSTSAMIAFFTNAALDKGYLKKAGQDLLANINFEKAKLFINDKQVFPPLEDKASKKNHKDQHPPTNELVE